MKRLPALALLPLAFALVACGSDDEELSAEDYKAEANQICEDGADRMEEIGSDLDENSSEDEIGTALNELLDEIEGQIDDIRELDGPDDAEEEVTAALDQADEAIEAMRDQVDEDPIAAAESTEFDAVNEALVDAGLDTCGGS